MDNKENWREEFDKNFGHYLYDSTYDIDAENQYDNVCDFIETQIAQAYKQGFEDCKVVYENGIKSALSLSSNEK